MSLAPGTSFAGYTIVRMLGTRGLGEVYLAQHPHLPRRDALKILPAAMTDDSEFHARFTQEAKIVTTLHHPHIVQVHDRGECEGRLWAAMDYVDATNVAELMRERFPAGMPPGQAQTIITAVAEALDYAHQRGMLHRDVQPARILLTNPGGGEHRVLLTDFGIAGPLDDAGTSAAAGLPLETRPYAAPEQLIGAVIDGRADQYGLAATAFHLLTGAPPYADPDPAAVNLRANVSDRRVDLARFDSVFSTAFADDPADRFGSCLEFAQALTEQAASSPGERTPAAVLTLDYPGEAANTSKVRSGEDVRTQLTAPTRRSTWVLLGIAFAAGLVLSTALLAVGFVIGRKNGTTSTDAENPGTVTSTVAGAPTTKTTPAPPLVVLDGSYRLDLNRVQQTYNETPDPQPPNVSTWWAFRSSCTPVGCLASGVLLDDANHQTRNAAAGGLFVALDLRADTWQSRPESVQFPCRARDGTAALETTTQVISLRPQSHSSLQGTMTVTVQTNECGQIGGRIVIPAVAVRVGDVPPGVDVPSPPPVTTPTR
jgi:serine/threonine protein kinase, bacterial